MFSSDWNSIGNGVIKRMSEEMSKEVDSELKDLSKVKPIKGRSCFSVSLINRMESYTSKSKLKLEPTFETDRVTVSWHADSSLEHYSTIGVYHVIVNEKGEVAEDEKEEEKCWRIACKVVPDAEGPNASTRTSKISDTSEPSPQYPLIYVPLKNKSIYYMLDDFNHHHQHAVLSPSSEGRRTVRYSSTHRLLRYGNNVEEVRSWRSERDSMGIYYYSRNSSALISLV